MKTPYDGALRVRRRELDEVRVDVARQTAEVARLADQRETITTDLRVEAEAARDALSTMINFGAYADRMTRRAAHIDAEKIVAEGQLDTLIDAARDSRSEEHTSELKSLMRISYAVFRLKIKTTNTLNY